MDTHKIKNLMIRLLTDEKIIIPSQYINQYDESLSDFDYYFKNNFDKHESNDMILRAIVNNRDGVRWAYQFINEDRDITIIDSQIFMSIINEAIEKGWEIPDNYEYGKTVDIISQLI